jgi:hypothetical protein
MVVATLDARVGLRLRDGWSDRRDSAVALVGPLNR